MEDFSDEVGRAFRALVDETPGFVDFFRQATPISEIAGLRIGSRPAARPDRGSARHRAGDTADQTKRATLLSINGIAAGLRNSG